MFIKCLGWTGLRIANIQVDFETDLGPDLDSGSMFPLFQYSNTLNR